jgi:hypothetical protein
MNTPVHPASAIARTIDGSSVTSMVTAADQILPSGSSSAHRRRRYAGFEPRLLSVNTA